MSSPIDTRSIRGVIVVHWDCDEDGTKTSTYVRGVSGHPSFNELSEVLHANSDLMEAHGKECTFVPKAGEQSLSRHPTCGAKSYCSSFAVGTEFRTSSNGPIQWHVWEDMRAEAKRKRDAERAALQVYDISLDTTHGIETFSGNSDGLATGAESGTADITKSGGRVCQIGETRSARAREAFQRWKCSLCGRSKKARASAAAEIEIEVVSA